MIEWGVLLRSTMFASVKRKIPHNWYIFSVLSVHTYVRTYLQWRLLSKPSMFWSDLFLHDFRCLQIFLFQNYLSICLDQDKVENFIMPTYQPKWNIDDWYGSLFKLSHHTPQWWSAWLETEGPLVGASPASLHCVLEQDTLILAFYWFNPGRPVPT